MVQLNEVGVLVMMVLGLVTVLIAYLKEKQIKLLFIGYTCLFLGALLTIIEEYTAPTLLNYLEHSIGILLAGIILFICAYKDNKKLNEIASNIQTQIKENKKTT